MIGVGLGLQFQQPRRRKKEQKGTPIRDGLVAEYLFDEGRGQILHDYSGHGNHGQLGSTRDVDTNDPLWTPQGLEFDGVDDFVVIADRDITICTIEMIVMLPTEDEMLYANNYIYDLRPSGQGYFNFQPPFGIQNLGAEHLYIDGKLSPIKLHQGGTTYLENENDIPRHRPVHLVFVFGQVDRTNNAYLFSRYTIVDRCLGATCFCMRCYTRAITPEEVQQNYQHSKTILAERGVILA